MSSTCTSRPVMIIIYFTFHEHVPLLYIDEKELITQPADAHYYKQCLRSFLHGFHRAMRRGLLGHFTLRPGTHFVARWESRIMWIQITEMSFTSVTVCHYLASMEDEMNVCSYIF